MKKWRKLKKTVTEKERCSARTLELYEEQLKIKCQNEGIRKEKIAHASERKLRLAETSEDEIERQKSKRKIQRYMMITLHLHVNNPQKELENIWEIND